MKTPTLLLTGLLAISSVSTLTPVAAQAATDDLLQARQGVSFVGSTLAGVALGGPVGLLAGAVVGAWLGDTLETAAEVGEVHQQLTATRQQLGESREQQLALRQKLQVAQDTSIQYAQLVLEQLELEMLFKTDKAELTDNGRRRLASLAAFLANNPQIAVRLDGYADPRGADSYNMQLSVGRVNHVARALQELGVAAERIATFSHGASKSSATAGDYDGYALERVVKINLSKDAAAGIAQAN